VDGRRESVFENVRGMVKTRLLSAPSTGQKAGLVAWLMGRDTSNASPHLVQR